MSAFVRTQLTATWTTGNYVPPVVDWGSLGNKASKSINGVRGGYWAPRLQRLILGGVGVGVSVTGPTVVNYDGTLEAVSGAKFRMGTSTDWPRLGTNHVGRTRKLLTSAIQALGTLDKQLEDFNAGQFAWLFNPTYHAIQSIACTLQSSVNDSAIPKLHQPRFTLPLRVHNASRLTQATLTFRVPFSRTDPPVVAPKIRIVRSDQDGNVQSLRSATDSIDSEGWSAVVDPLPTSGGEWYSNGEAQTYECICDQNNAIDTSTYTYFAEVQEEKGTIEVIPFSIVDGSIVRAIHKVVRITVSASINGTPFPAMIDGDRMLIINRRPYARAGIWLIDNAGSSWIRSKLMNSSSLFSPYLLAFGPDVDDFNTIKLYEMTTPNPVLATALVQDVGDGPLELFTAIHFNAANNLGDPYYPAALTPRGNIYHSVVCEFDSIVDMRPQ